MMFLQVKNDSIFDHCFHLLFVCYFVQNKNIVLGSRNSLNYLFLR